MLRSQILSENELNTFKGNVLSNMEQKLKHHRWLYDLTNHSKKKTKHLCNIRLMERVIGKTQEEYKIQGGI